MKKWIAGGIVGFLLAVAGTALAAEPLAFVTELKGEATIQKAAGEKGPVAVGAQLVIGDRLKVEKGKVVLIYLSGRSVEVKAGQEHLVQMEKGKPSPLMGRLKDTLGEIVGPKTEAERPVVQGMAREVTGLTGALPANSRISRPDFTFVWDALEGATGYEFTLESATGEALGTYNPKENRLAAAGLELKPGVRYLWQVEETESFLPRGSGRSWILVATPQEREQLQKTLTQIEEIYSGETGLLLKAAALFAGEFYFEAERMLVALQKERGLTTAEQRVLQEAYAKMQRWDRLSAGDEEKGEAKGDQEK